MDYKNTVFLPKTSFPMKANLANREHDFLEHWKNLNLYKKLREKSKDRKKFILHFGPPYANGHIHIGHAFTEILKDIVNKTHQMLGYDAPMIPGWDCHGLPIEWKIEEGYRASGINKDDVNILEFREECRSFAAKWVNVQREEFKRLGVVADWDTPYSTMDFATEARIIEQLGHFLINGGLYRGLRPVMWSVVEKTALAEAEIEYKDHTSDSIYVTFPITKTTLDVLKGVEVVIWTTTPWTLPGNQAVAYGKDCMYTVVEISKSKRRLLIASDLVKSVMSSIECADYVPIANVKGHDLFGSTCSHPLKEQGYSIDVSLLPGEHVTIDTGTGLVHTAPGHGVEDFEIGKAFNLEVLETVAEDGRYYDHVPSFAGLHIFKVNPLIIDALKSNGRLLHAGKIIHSYPHSWRSKAPLIYRATAQWFVSMDKNNLREKALAEINAVSWYPEQGRNRISSMVESRPDWCLSRQRAWGTPMTLFVHKKTGDVLRDEAVHARIVEAVRKKGGDAWYTMSAADFLKPDYDPNDFEKVTDILDVWFDSGCSHFFVLQDRPDQAWPADLYLEGSDQHRGWFQTSLLASCGITGKAPYKRVMTHGFALDEKGYKMSKSLGNVVAPSQVIDSMGADILRLWVASTNYTEDMRIGPEILKQQEDVYRRFRNTLRYLLGALDGFTKEESVTYAEMPSLEKWVLNRLSEMDKLLKQSAESFDLMRFYSALHEFCALDVSAFYLDIRKDCLYCDDPDSLKRRATRTVMNHLFHTMCLWLAPVLSFTAEEAWQTRYNTLKDSVHLQDFPDLPEEWANPKNGKKWETIRDVRRVMTGALEVERAAKTIGSSLQADIAVYVPAEIAALMKSLDISELAITSNAELIVAQPPAGAFILEDVEHVGVVVNQAKGEKCSRCWKILPEITQNESQICNRCYDVVRK